MTDYWPALQAQIEVTFDIAERLKYAEACAEWFAAEAEYWHSWVEGNEIQIDDLLVVVRDLTTALERARKAEDLLADIAPVIKEYAQEEYPVHFFVEWMKKYEGIA